MVFGYFYIAYNEGLFSGMDVEFMEGLGNVLLFVSFALLIPIVVFYEDKKTKSLIKCLAVFIPILFGALFISDSIPYKETVRIVNYEDKSKYVLVEGLDVAKEAVKLANDDNVRNKEKIESTVEDLLKIEKK